MRSVQMLMGLALAWLALPAGLALAADTGTWLPGSPVNADNTDSGAGEDIAVAQNAAGDRAIVWRNRVGAGDSYLSVRRSKAGSGVWGPQQRLEDVRPAQYALPRVVVDAAGATTVLWERSFGREAATGIWAVHAAPDERFGTPDLVGEDRISIGNRWMRAAAADDGSVLAAWVAGDNQLHVASRSASGTWGPDRALGQVGNIGTVPALAVNGAGRAVLAWNVDDESFAVVGDVDGTFGPPQALERGDTLSTALKVDVGPTGHAVVAVFKFDWWTTPPAPIFTLAPGSTTFVARGASASVEEPEAVSVGVDGRAWVVGSLWGTADEGDPTRFALPVGPDGTLRSAVPVGFAGSAGDQAQAVRDDRGNLHVVWRAQFDASTAHYEAELLSLTVSPDGRVGPVRSLARSLGRLIYLHDVAGGAEPFAGFVRAWFGSGELYVAPVSVGRSPIMPIPTPRPTTGPVATPSGSPTPAAATPTPAAATPTSAAATPTPKPPASPTATPEPSSVVAPAATPGQPPAAPLAPLPVASTPTPTTAPSMESPAALFAVTPIAGLNATPSAATRTCVVPKVQGLTRTQARKRLSQAGCASVLARTVRRTRARIVVKQSPTEGIRPHGYRVRLVVSR